MAFWLDGWCGDNAGEVTGREPNTLLVALTTEAGEYPPGLFLHSDALGFTSYYECSVDCLTANARDAVATSISFLGGNLVAIQLAELELGGGKEPWAKGIHLFGVSLNNKGNQSATFATAFISGEVASVKPSRTALWALSRSRTTGLQVAGPDLRSSSGIGEAE
jgi:hypothetical protein